MNNIFESIPEELADEHFDRLVDNGSVGIERIVSKGHRSPESGWYDQQRNEWVMILKGEAILLFENDSSIRLKAGDYINIEAHRKHKVEWTTPDTETIWLAVHY